MNHFLRRNWFKILVVGFIIFLMLKKDFSFQINLRSPLREEVPQEEEQIPVQQPREQNSGERYTELASPDQKETEEQQSNIFNLNPIGGNGRSPNVALQEFNKVDQATIAAFIKRFGHVAVSERKKYGIPASLILANGLLISRAGTSELVSGGHNYFGLGCTSDWIGEQGFYGGSCFRHYENAWTSFRDHSLFLTTGRLAKLTSLGRDDYEAWAKALQKENFYQEKKSDKAIVSIIQQYQLDRYDRD